MLGGGQEENLTFKRQSLVFSVWESEWWLHTLRPIEVVAYAHHCAS